MMKRVSIISIIMLAVIVGVGVMAVDYVFDRMIGKEIIGQLEKLESLPKDEKDAIVENIEEVEAEAAQGIDSQRFKMKCQRENIP